MEGGKIKEIPENKRQSVTSTPQIQASWNIQLSDSFLKTGYKSILAQKLIFFGAILSLNLLNYCTYCTIEGSFTLLYLHFMLLYVSTTFQRKVLSVLIHNIYLIDIVTSYFSVEYLDKLICLHFFSDGFI